MSVTTAVYMLALQEMTTVPFRCVDEINQGLDERNERRVWDMILSAATEGQGSQYFYLAPKMPYNLNYRPGNSQGINPLIYTLFALQALWSTSATPVTALSSPSPPLTGSRLPGI